jgi:hypothetical protein
MGTQQPFPRFGGANLGFGLTACSMWPRSEAIAVSNLRSRHAVVLIGNDYDPSTPMTWSRNMTTALGKQAHLVRYQGGGHVIYGLGSACVDAPIEAYFRDLAVPAPGLTCPAMPVDFRQSASALRELSMADVLEQVTPQRAFAPRPRLH